MAVEARGKADAPDRGHDTGMVLSGARRWPAEAIEKRAARAGAGFSAFGIGAGDAVAILMRNDIAFIEATLGVQRAGGYPVPLNWHLKGPEVRYILQDCGARLLVGHADLIGSVRDALPARLDVISVETPPEIASAYRLSAGETRAAAGDPEWEAWLAAQDPTRAPAPGPARDSIIYTSGTTGHPKGVRRQPADPAMSGNIAALRRTVYGYRPGMRTAVVPPMYHSAPNSYFLNAVQQGAFMLLMSRFEPEPLLAAIEAHRLTHLLLVPTMFVRLLKLPEAVRSRYDVSSLEFVLHVGAPCPPDVKTAMIAWWGPVIREFYGSTEAGPITFCDSAEALRKPGTVGRRVPGAQVEIVRDDGSLAAPGEVGEIFVRHTYYADFTYVGRDDLRSEIDRDGMITCGDVGFFDPDGFLFICDRKRDMVIVGGVNVYPAEIENVLTGMKGVRDCAVFGVPHPEYGEELMACVQPLEGESVAPDEIRTFLATRIADFKVPRRIEIRADLPREDTGKIFKRRLRDPYWEGQGRAV